MVNDMLARINPPERKTRRWAKHFGVLVLLGMLVSCGSRTFDTEEALWAFIADGENGLVQQRTVQGIEYKITYRPTDLLVGQELGDDHGTAMIDSLRHKYGEYLYFTLTMSKNGQELLNGLAGNRTDFGNMVNQLAFGMGEKIHLISPQRDTIALLDYIYPRMYGTGNSTNMLLVYPRSKALLKNEYFRFTIQDLGFGTGEVGFKIPTGPIKKEPGLDFKKLTAYVQSTTK